MNKNQEEINRLLGRYLSSDATEDEKRQLAQKIEEEGEDLQQLILLDSLFKGKEDNNAIVNTKNSKSDIWAKLNEKEKSSKIHRLSVGFRRIAAIFVIQLILTSLAYYYFQSKNKPSAPAFAEIQCPLGARINFELPDGTTGYLNSGSSLGYSVDFSKYRNVKVAGEAYFDVFHDSKHPFIVQAENINVKVLGTKFNLISYQDDLTEEVILNEGSVEVLASDGKVLSKIEPNQMFVLEKDKKVYRIDEVDSEQYSSWTDGKLVFKNETMEKVAKRLGRWYNADIIIEDKELLQYTYRATFIDEELEEVLKLIALTAPIKYEEIKREITNDTYSKRKIILKLDDERKIGF